MVFEAGSELKLVTDGVVTVTIFVVLVDTDAGVGEVTFAPSEKTVKHNVIAKARVKIWKERGLVASFKETTSAYEILGWYYSVKLQTKTSTRQYIVQLLTT